MENTVETPQTTNCADAAADVIVHKSMPNECVSEQFLNGTSAQYRQYWFTNSKRCAGISCMRLWSLKWVCVLQSIRSSCQTSPYQFNNQKNWFVCECHWCLSSCEPRCHCDGVNVIVKAGCWKSNACGESEMLILQMLLTLVLLSRPTCTKSMESIHWYLVLPLATMNRYRDQWLLLNWHIVTLQYGRQACRGANKLINNSCQQYFCDLLLSYDYVQDRWHIGYCHWHIGYFHWLCIYVCAYANVNMCLKVTDVKRLKKSELLELLEKSLRSINTHIVLVL